MTPDQGVTLLKTHQAIKETKHIQNILYDIDI